jgi:hypothetical protein
MIAVAAVAAMVKIAAGAVETVTKAICEVYKTNQVLADGEPGLLWF